MQNSTTFKQIEGRSTVWRARPTLSGMTVPDALRPHRFERMVIDTRAQSVETVLLTSMKDHLAHAVNLISVQPEQLRVVRNVIANPQFIATLQAKIWPKTDAQIKVDVRSLTEQMLTQYVNAAIRSTSENSVSDDARRLITAILGVALEHHGIVSIDIASFAIRTHESLIPDWDTIVEAGLRGLAQAHFSKIKPENGLQRKGVARVALIPLATMFDDINIIIDAMVRDRHKFEALAAAGVARTMRYSEELGDLEGMVEEREVIEFSQNATFVTAYLDKLEERGHVVSAEFILEQMLRVPALNFAQRISAAASILREVPEFRLITMDQFRRNTNIRHVNDFSGGLSGVIIQPNYRVADAKFMVSEYLGHTIGRNLIQHSDLEAVFNGALGNVTEVIASLPQSAAFIFEHITEQYHAGVALDISAEAVDEKGVQVSDIIYPLCVGLDVTPVYLRMVAIAHSTMVSFVTDERGTRLAYTFDAKQKDVHRVLHHLAEETCFSDEPSIVVAFGTTSSENLGVWEVGTQNVNINARSARYIGHVTSDDEEVISLLGRSRNYIDRDWELEVNIPAGGGESVTVARKINLYELVTASKYYGSGAIGSDHLYVHYAPALVNQFRTVIDFFLSINRDAVESGAINSVSSRLDVMLASTMQPIVSSGAFRALLAAVRAQMTVEMNAAIDDRAKRNFLRKRIVTGELDVDLSSALLIELLQFAHLITHSQATELTKVATRRDYRQAMLTALRK